MNAELTDLDAETATELLNDDHQRHQYETRVTVTYENVHGNETERSGVVTHAGFYGFVVDTLEEQDDGTPILFYVDEGGRVDSRTGDSDRRLTRGGWHASAEETTRVTIDEVGEADTTVGCLECGMGYDGDEHDSCPTCTDDEPDGEVCTDGGVAVQDGGHETNTVETTSVWTTAASVTEGATITVRYDSIKGSGSKAVSGEVSHVVARRADESRERTVPEALVEFKRDDDGHRMTLKSDGLLRTTGSHYPKVGRIESITIERGLPEPARPEVALREVAEQNAADDAFHGHRAVLESPVEGENIVERTLPETYLTDDEGETDVHEVSQGVAWASDLMLVFDVALTMDDDREKVEDDEDARPSLEDRVEADETDAGYPVSVDLTNGAGSWTENGRLVGLGALNEGDRVAVVLDDPSGYHSETVSGRVTQASNRVVVLETPTGAEYAVHSGEVGPSAGHAVLTTDHMDEDGLGVTVEHGRVAHYVRLNDGL